MRSETRWIKHGVTVHQWVVAPPNSRDQLIPTGDGDDEPVWSNSFPHQEIDALVERLTNSRSGSKGDAYRLLALVASEAQRLRTTTIRLSASKLAEADQEARAIVAQANRDADALRAHGMDALNARLDEADSMLSTLRSAFQVEHRAAERADFEDGQAAGR